VLCWVEGYVTLNGGFWNRGFGDGFDFDSDPDFDFDAYFAEATKAWQTRFELQGGGSLSLSYP